MDLKPTGRNTLSAAHRVAMAALVLAGCGLLLDWRLSAFIVAIFMVVCMIAPFLPQFGFYLPVISRGCSGQPAVALTFDDGPDPIATPALLDLLRRHNAVATFFVSGSKVVENAHIVEAILENGHSIGNHAYHHDPLVLFKGRKAIQYEIESTQRLLSKFGIRPLVYRPPVGILSPGLAAPLRQAGLQTVNFSCRAFDHGNRKISGLAERILGTVKADDIILLHDIMPLGQDHLATWLKEMGLLLEGLTAMGLSVAPLDELIKMPVMMPTLHGQKTAGDGIDG